MRHRIKCEDSNEDSTEEEDEGSHFGEDSDNEFGNDELLDGDEGADPDQAEELAKAELQ